MYSCESRSRELRQAPDHSRLRPRGGRSAVRVTRAAPSRTGSDSGESPRIAVRDNAAVNIPVSSRSVGGSDTVTFRHSSLGEDISCGAVGLGFTG